MKTVGWMLSLIGAVIGVFTAWTEHMPGLQYHLILPHGRIPGSDITLAASLLAFLAVGLMWVGFRRFGGVLVVLGAILGLFGADQLWTTAGCVLFVGAVLSLFAPTETGKPEAEA